MESGPTPAPARDDANPPRIGDGLRAIGQESHSSRADSLYWDCVGLSAPRGRSPGCGGLSLSLLPIQKKESLGADKIANALRLSDDSAQRCVHAAELAGILAAEIIERVNDLFEGDLADEDKLVYVNNVIMGKLLESKTLKQQATNNTKEQFANSPDLKSELMNAIIGALEAHTAMSTQALSSETVRSGIKDVLLGPGGLYESLREQAVGETAEA